MPIEDGWYAKNENNLKSAPKSHGVYILYEGDRLIYIGRAAGKDVTINSRLNSHASGSEGACTKAFTHYRREKTENAEARETELLEEYKQANNGQRPACNDVG